MLKVMIVEDEDIVREDIKHLIDWEKHGFTITAEARNGGEGLRICMEQNPDIIITDIKMPVMGGLEMINRILRIQKNKKIILLTAYGDFDFAREAINLGIHSYVLKHELDSGLLIQELNKLKHQMTEEESMDYLARKEHLRMFLKRIEGHHGDVEMNPGNLFRWQGRTGIIIFGIDQLTADKLASSNSPQHVDRNEWMEFLYTQVFHEIEAEVVDLYEQDYLIFFKIPEYYSERKILEYSSVFAHQLQLHISTHFRRTVSIAIGPVFENYSDIRGGLQKTKEIFALKIFRKVNSILTKAPMPLDIELQQASIKQKLKEIQEELIQERFIDVHKSLDELFIHRLTSLQDVKLLRNCIFELIRLINLKGTARHTQIIEPFEKLMEIQQLENVFQISEWFKNIVDQLEEEASSRYSKKIRELLQYIHANYQKDITLDEISNRVGFSLIYTSQLFKKEVGVSFVIYLTKYRIEKAKELLESGNYKVYEVSSMVGYQTVQYFTKTFKKITGKNPGDHE
ncbi:response regulator [Paenibacillus agricola]|uniref:Response regulator n=1 Tax=Paenibacillus agricola TaxID=2716264 RepID=A0ABX0J367_9BACL|nr:response regulator [Paenibacillus agricola]NHN29851.1 response regulator [Paenibacillus agricola]